MTAQQIVNDLILDNQNLVIEELMKHDECLWDELAYDCYWWGRQTSGQGLSMDWVIQKIARQTER